MLKYLEEFRNHKNVIVQTSEKEYRVSKLIPNKFQDGKDEIHVKIKGSSLTKSKKEFLGVIGLYNFKLRPNRMRNKFDALMGKTKTLSIYVVFTNVDDKLMIILKALPPKDISVSELLKEVGEHYNGEVSLNGELINPKLDDVIVNSSDLPSKELANPIRITGY